MRKVLALLLAIILVVSIFGCKSNKDSAVTTGSASESIESTESVTSTVKETTEETTTEKDTKTEEVNTTQESTTEKVTEKIDVKEIDRSIQGLWKIVDVSPKTNYSTSNFLFSDGILLGGSSEEFKHEYKTIGRYTITEDGKIEIQMMSIVFGTVTKVVYTPAMSDTGEELKLYCENCEGISYFAGKEDESDYTITFARTNYPSESKSNDARLKGVWVDQKSGVMMSFDYATINSNTFSCSVTINDEKKTGTWRGYSGEIMIVFTDGSNETYKYVLNKNCTQLMVTIKDREYQLTKLVPDY